MNLKTAQLVGDIKYCYISILRLCELRWRRFANRFLNTRKTMLFSDQMEENALRSEEVALIVSKEEEEALKMWKAMSS